MVRRLVVMKGYSCVCSSHVCTRFNENRCFKLSSIYFFQMSRYTASQQYRLIKMLPLANGKAVKRFLSSLLHSQFRRKGFIPHCIANDGLVPTTGKRAEVAT